MDMSGMDHGSMDSDAGAACVISMLWNWNTINTCFISSTWHVRSKGAFAGSCIGVICLVILLEGLKRLQRGYDRVIVMKAREKHVRTKDDSGDEAEIGSDGGDENKNIERRRHSRQPKNQSGPSSSVSPCCRPAAPASSTTTTPAHSTPGIPFLSAVIQTPSGLPRARLTVLQQSIRALIHTCQFSVAYFVMLLAMYFNGYIIICIFIGAYIGNFMFSWDVVEGARCNDAQEVTGCCG